MPFRNLHHLGSLRAGLLEIRNGGLAARSRSSILNRSFAVAHDMQITAFVAIGIATPHFRHARAIRYPGKVVFNFWSTACCASRKAGTIRNPNGRIAYVCSTIANSPSTHASTEDNAIPVGG